MKSLAAFLAVLTFGSGFARAKDQPQSAPPIPVPPAPPEQLPPPPEQQVQMAPPEPTPQVAQQAPATGQWVYTQQYGWVWAPYGDEYTYAPTQEGAYPQEYLYSPSYGWTWFAAPWVFGWGVSPYFGVYGPAHFGWYGRLTASGWRGYNGGYGYRPGYNGYGRPAYNAGPRGAYGRAPTGSFGRPGGSAGGRVGGSGGGVHGSGGHGHR